MKKTKTPQKLTPVERKMRGLPEEDWVDCGIHGGKVDLAKLPSSVELEGTSITMANALYGCAECIAEEVAKVAKEQAEKLAAEEEARKRAAEEKRAAKRKLIEDARATEKALRSALTAREEVEALPDPSEAKRAVEAAEGHLRKAERKLREAKVRLDDAVLARDNAKADLDFVRDKAERAVEGRVEVSDVLEAAVDAAEEAWAKVPRIKREKLRDRELRKRARDKVGRR